MRIVTLIARLPMVHLIGAFLLLYLAKITIRSLKSARRHVTMECVRIADSVTKQSIG